MLSKYAYSVVRATVFIIMVMASWLFLPDTVYAQTARSDEVAILVPPFENLSAARAMVNYEVATNSNPDHPKRSFRVDRYTEAPRAILEDILGEIEGINIVERQRVDAILLEADFGRFSGLVDPEKAVKLGKLLGANYIVMGSILDVRTTTTNFSGYGVRTKNAEVKSSIRLKVVDGETGKIVYSTITKGAVTYPSTQFGGVSSSDVAYEVLEDALEKLRADEKFKATIFAKKQKPSQVIAATAAVSPPSTGTMEIEFSPKPDNCDIEIDGKYVGGSPVKRTMMTDKPVKVKISKAGYRSWEGIILPEAGLKVTPELVQEPGQSGDPRK